MSIQAVRGFNDVFEAQTTAILQAVEQLLIQTAQSHGYSEVRLPFLEKAELYRRSIGETSDIVNKEMYTFSDKNDDTLCLRPEGTASCIRAAIEHNVLYQHSRKWYYLSPMFRRERPQKGRYRQFYQFGMEAIGLTEPFVDVEHLIVIHTIFKKLGVADKIQLNLNYLGTSDTRMLYTKALTAYYEDHCSNLSAIDQIRLRDNPLRILDSKEPNIQALNKNAPSIHDYYSNEEKTALSKVIELLNQHGIDHSINPHLVRGLDYYTGTIYEWIAPELGAQSTVCGGGRYDKLAEQLDAERIPATGFSIGMERLIELIDTSSYRAKPSLLWINLTDTALQASLNSCHQLRTACPSLAIDNNFEISKIKSALKKANKRGYTHVIIAGEDELQSGVYQLKCMTSGEQQSLNIAQIIAYIQREITL